MDTYATTGADHHNRFRRPQFHSLPQRVQGCIHGVSDNRRLSIGQLRRNVDQVTGGQLHILSKSTVNMHAHKPPEVSAQVFPPAVTPATVTTGEIEIDDDSITSLNGADP